MAFSKNTDRIICYPLSSNNQEQSSMVWPCHDERRRVSAEVCDEGKDEGKDTTGKIKTNVVIDSHMKGKSKSRKEILRTKCFKNIQDLRTLISLTGVLEKILELLPGVW